MKTIFHYLGLVRFSHTLFALPFALLSYGMALKMNFLETPPIPFRWFDLAGILLCMVFARSAAMGFNRFADQRIDAENPRTASRHLPSGILASTNVLLFVAICSLGFIASTLLFLPNRIPLVASVPLLLFLFGYSYTKRWTVAAHFWLGAALMLAPLAAWVAVRGELFPVPIPPLLLGLGVLFWTAGFDLIYAAQDADIDKQQGLYSVPGRYGITIAFRLSALCHFAALILWSILPMFYPPLRGTMYGIGIGLVAVVLLVEHYLVLPRRNRPVHLGRINVAFFQMNVLVSVGLAIIGILEIIKR
ncbi:MAG: putative 4-hydroxybenzoate polyprenyltransferase [Planctomycetaceae bacterium]|jgi:4-hydroxybenzoate polyprenyltransferase|nr:putative 4-hydroxybenzoate polyprenyltransferase [Planctomycetaceae bacterium]